MTSHLPYRLIPMLAFVAGCNTGAPGPAVEVPVEVAQGSGPMPRVLRSSADGSGGICRLHELSVTFDMPMDPASIDERRFVLTDEGVPVAGRVSLDGTGRTARFVPVDPAGFPPSRAIVAALLSGADGVRGRTGQPMAQDRVWVFSTGWQPCNGRGLMAPASRLDPLPNERSP